MYYDSYIVENYVDLTLRLSLYAKHALKTFEKYSFAIVVAFSVYALCAYAVGQNDLVEAKC